MNNREEQEKDKEKSAILIRKKTEAHITADKNMAEAEWRYVL